MNFVWDAAANRGLQMPARQRKVRWRPFGDRPQIDAVVAAGASGSLEKRFLVCASVRPRSSRGRTCNYQFAGP